MGRRIAVVKHQSPASNQQVSQLVNHPAGQPSPQDNLLIDRLVYQQKYLLVGPHLLPLKIHPVSQLNSQPCNQVVSLLGTQVVNQAAVLPYSQLCIPVEILLNILLLTQVDSLVVDRLVDRHTNLLGNHLVSRLVILVQHLRQSLVEGPFCVRLSLQMTLIQLYRIFKCVDFPRAKMILL